MKISAGILFIMVVSSLGTSCKTDEENTLPYYTTADFTPQWLNKKQAASIHSIPGFSFTDQDGKVLNREFFEDKISVVDFFFTSCPGICKKLTTSMVKVQEAFVNNNDVLLLSHSVTPERDSVPVLKKYANENGVLPGKWHLVTGKRSEIYSIARTAYFADEDMGWKQDSSIFLHTENILLIDKYHHIRGVYKGTIPAEVNELISDIKELQKEE